MIYTWNHTMKTPNVFLNFVIETIPQEKDNNPILILDDLYIKSNAEDKKHYLKLTKSLHDIYKLFPELEVIPKYPVEWGLKHICDIDDSSTNSDIDLI